MGHFINHIEVEIEVHSLIEYLNSRKLNTAEVKNVLDCTRCFVEFTGTMEMIIEHLSSKSKKGKQPPKKAAGDKNGS